MNVPERDGFVMSDEPDSSPLTSERVSLHPTMAKIRRIPALMNGRLRAPSSSGRKDATGIGAPVGKVRSAEEAAGPPPLQRVRARSALPTLLGGPGTISAAACSRFRRSASAEEQNRPELFGPTDSAVGCLLRLTLHIGNVKFFDSPVLADAWAESLDPLDQLFGAGDHALWCSGQRLSGAHVLASYVADVAFKSTLSPLERARDLLLVGACEKAARLSREEAEEFEASLPGEGTWFRGAMQLVAPPSLADVAIFVLATKSRSAGYLKLMLPVTDIKHPKICAIRDVFQEMPQVQTYLEKYGRNHLLPRQAMLDRPRLNFEDLLPDESF
eukprot:TRINITY_DN49093_c0_g1_i3.p1 TRINITY_DN49093_c0_g1~~TRINITY_DN49093_c0_g1_i3.p1  ORF type:complete len:329 (+),score=60.52 TRINITY_DN49093_c0_g1_i3:63-1049(+)